MIFLVLGNNLVILRTLTQEDVVHAKAILDPQDKWDTRMVKQVLANVFRVDNSVNSVTSQLTLRANTTEHEQLRALKDTLGEDDFAGGVEVELLSGAGNNGHAFAGAVGFINDEVLRMILG